MSAAKTLVKALLWAVAALTVLPFVVLVKIFPKSRADSAFQFSSQWLSLIPGGPGVLMRQAFYFLILDAPWPGPRISFATTLAQRDTGFGRGVYVGALCNLGRCYIGSRTLLGSGVFIASSKAHGFEDASKPIDDQGGEIRKVSIGADCWIGNAAVVMADLEDGVVIGAGSVVTKPCERFGVYVGNPARLVKKRTISDSALQSK